LSQAEVNYPNVSKMKFCVLGYLKVFQPKVLQYSCKTTVASLS